VPAGRGGSPAEVFSAEGTLLGRAPDLSEEDEAFGGALAVAACADGRVLLALGRPGIWLEHDAESFVRRGQEIFPDMPPPRVTQEGNEIVINPAQAAVSGIGCVGDDLVAEVVRRYPDPFDPEDWSTLRDPELLLAVFGRDGRLRAKEELTSEGRLSPSYAYISPVTGHVFVPMLEPYPGVVEYELREVSRRAGIDVG
jgi:hypothetical protein